MYMYWVYLAVSDGFPCCHLPLQAIAIRWDLSQSRNRSAKFMSGI